MALRDLVSMISRIDEKGCVRCNLSIFPASADGEIGYVSFDRRTEDGASDYEMLVHRNDRCSLGDMLQGVADCRW